MTGAIKVEIPQEVDIAVAANEQAEVAQQFISTDPDKSASKTKAKKAKVKIALPPRKKKTARLQLVVYPEIAEALKQQSEETGRSINDICGYILSEALGLNK